MLIVRSQNDVHIRLTEERWGHIVRRHPEMESLQERALETVSQPEMIQEGDFGELLAVRFYAETSLTSKFLVVAYREIRSNDGFIVTAYLATRLSTRRKTIWKS